MENAGMVEKVIVATVVLAVCLIVIIAKLKHNRKKRDWVEVPAILVRREAKYESCYHWVEYNFNGSNYVSCADSSFTDEKCREVGSALTVLVNPNAPHKSHMVSYRKGLEA